MTNRELLMMLDGDLGERAIKNCIESFGDEYYLDKKGYSVSDTLLGAFTFYETQEGDGFWRRIYNATKQSGL